MKLSFYGADRCVTGSCHCIQACGKTILVDCGLQQGQDERDNQALPFHPGQVDYVLVTHAHIDHTGRLPLLVKGGYQGQIFASRLTCQLMSIMLRDSAHIQESDAKWASKKAQRAGQPPVEPLYTVADAEETVLHFYSCEYGETVPLCDGISFRMTDAGHLLGSSMVELWITEDGVTKKIVFSGDLGNIQQPIIRDPQTIAEADYVVMESTYGDRNHEPPKSYTADLAAILEETFAKGGNVVIPSFAVGRTQELLYFLREIKQKGLVKSNPNFEVCVDSPLAAEATRIYAGNLDGYLDEESKALVEDGVSLFQVENLQLSVTAEESKALNLDRTPKVIISASGMCDAGRIRHHLKHNLWRPECAVVFVGFQAKGSLGRALLEGKKEVHIAGEDVRVRAKIVNFQGLSSHADRDHLLAWISAFQSKLSQVFVVHGEAEVADGFAQTLRERGLSAHAPDYTEVYDLAANALVQKGVPAPARTESKWTDGSPAYRRLEDVGVQLQDLIRANKGASNKDLAKFADQLRAVMQNWAK